MSIIVFDTETNGLPIKNDYSNIRMLELGYIILDLDFNILKEVNYMSNVNVEIPEIVKELTGITHEKMIEYGIEPIEILSFFLKDLENADIIIAHNNRFDLGVLRQEFKIIGSEKIFENKIYKKINLDSIQIFKSYIKKSEINNYKLQTIYKYYHKDEDYIQTHRALDDCVMLCKSLNNLKNFNPYIFYLNKKFNFSKYPNHNLKQIYIKDHKYVINFLKKIPISKNIFKFL